MRKIFSGFYLDLRSLALMRVLLGIILLCDIYTNIVDIDYFFTDLGIFPRAKLIEEVLFSWNFSIFLMNGSKLFVSILFCIQAFLAFNLIIGNKTKFSAFFSWIMLTSVQDRSWFILNGGDDILRCVIFFSIFLPISERFSFDRALLTSQKDEHDHRYLSVWNIVLIFQLGIIYFFSFLLKDHNIWRGEYSALYYALNLNLFVSSFGKVLLNYYSVTKGLTFLAIKAELWGAIVLFFHGFFGRYSDYIRFVVIALFISFHLGLILMFNLGLFPFVLIAIWCGLLPSFIWKNKNYNPAPDIVYYDGNCSFCKKGVYLIKVFFSLDIIILPGQSNQKVLAKMEKLNSWIIYNQDTQKYYSQYHAFIYLIKGHFLIRLFNNSLSAKLGGLIYYYVSNHRSLFSKLTKPFSFSNYTFKKNVFFEIFGLLTLTCIIGWNLEGLPKIGSISNKLFYLSKITRSLHLYQNWTLFAPFPKTDNIWYEISGELEDKSLINLVFDKASFENLETSFLKKAQTKHWRKFFLTMSEDSRLYKFYGDFLCRDHNKKVSDPSKRLKKIDFIFYSQINLLNNQKKGLTRSVDHEHDCY